VSKDRAAPFSRKHRRYWIPVTGGMILIGGINLAIGVCSYSTPPPTQPMVLHLPSPDQADAGVPGMMGPGAIPAVVMRAFAIKFPKNIPAGALHDGTRYIVVFRPGAVHQRATFDADGTFVSVE
jgi:hypothetical protein